MTEPLSQLLPSARPAFRRAAWLRLPAFCLVATLASWLLSHFGLASRLDAALSDHIAFSETIAPSGNTVLIVIDETTIAQTGRYPFERTMMARALDQLRQANTGRIYLEASLSSQETAADDAALEAALQRLGPDRIALPVSRLPTADGSEIALRPLERFARHARLVSMGFIFDADRRSRRIQGAKSGQEMPVHDWLRSATETESQRDLVLDFAIDPTALPQFRLTDLADGRVPPEALKGKSIIIGLLIPSPQSAINVPKYQRLNRIEMAALATETALKGARFRAMSTVERVSVTLAIVLAFGAILTRFGSLTGFMLTAGVVVLWLYWLADLQVATGLQWPTLAPPLACLVLWQIMKLRHSRLAQAISKRYTRLVGVGENALVVAADVIADPAFVFDHDGRIKGANQPFRQLMASSMPEGRESWKSGVKTIFPHDHATILNSFAAGTTSSVALSLPIGGETRYFDASIRAVETITSPLAIASLKDVTEVRNREKHLTNLAFRDALTGLSNRVAFHARLHKLSEDPAGRVSILLLDLDGFKLVNDRLGHHAGDLLLTAVAQRLQGLVRPNDMVARLGGDEFAILQPGADEFGAARLAQRIIAALVEPFDLEGQPGTVGTSIGIAAWPEHHAEPLEALKMADAAMYVAKQQKPAYAIHGDLAPRKAA